jgi:hypothetical protein
MNLLLAIVVGLFRVVLAYAVLSAAESRFETNCFALLLLIYNQVVGKQVFDIDNFEELEGRDAAAVVIAVVCLGIAWLYAMFRLVIAVWPRL